MIVKEKTIVTNKDWFNLAIFGDWHLGNMDCDEKKVESASNFLGTRKKDQYGVILVGDLMENVVLGSKGTPFELNIPDPAEQATRSAEYIKKFKNILLASVEGNHELRTRKRTGQFLNKSVLEKVYNEKEVNEKYFCYCGLLNLQFKNTKGKNLKKYRIYITHGVGNASSNSGKITKLYSLRDKAEADLYVQGHMHAGLGTADYTISNGTLRKRMFLCCSSYLIEASYAVEFGFKPTDYGINKISLNTKTSEMIGYY